VNRPLLLTLLCSLFWLSACSDEPVAQQATESKDQPLLQGLLYFTPLGFTSRPGQTGKVIRYNKEELPDNSSRYWRMEAFELPAYSRIDADHFIDRLNLESGLSYFHITESNSYLPFESQAAWLHIRASAKPVHNRLSRWFPFMPSSDIAGVLAADRERRSKLAESLADDAYFFGYAADEDALE